MKKTYRTIFLIYNIITLILGIFLAFTLPKILNYPPNSINNEFERNIDAGQNYYIQFAVIILSGMIVSNITILVELWKLKKERKKIEKCENNIEEKEKQFKKIRSICFTSPIKLYLIHALIPSIFIAIILLLTETDNSLVLRLSIVSVFVFFVIGLLIYISTKKIFSSILQNMNNDKTSEKISSTQFSSKIFFQILPLTLLIGAIMYLVTNSVGINEKSNILYNEYSVIINECNISQSNSLDEVIGKLNTARKINKKDTLFIIKDKDYSVVYQDNENEITDFFIKYTFMEGKDGHTYGYYATDIEGVYTIIEIDGVKYAAGVMYDTSITSGYIYFIMAIIVLFIIVVAFLIYFSNDISAQVKIIIREMKKLNEGEKIDYDQKIPVTSNDELGELTVNFNKILDLEKKNIETIEKNKEALVESERLSSLGQLIGGVAHNLKTPIMSISGNLQGLQDLIMEYDTSIGDPEVNEQDHKDIAKDMKELVDKTRVHLSYMSDVISAVKGQAVELDSSQQQIFSASEVVSRVEILMRHELKNALIELNTQLDENARSSYIKGDINSLVQVINNLIQNSIYAYNGEKNKVIDFKVDVKDKNVCFSVKDYGCGIPENVKQKLFKEMITTKGKNGTGLGLYMSYSTIRGKFNGSFEYESELGKGTTFYITIPINEE